MGLAEGTFRTNNEGNSVMMIFEKAAVTLVSVAAQIMIVATVMI